MSSTKQILFLTGTRADFGKLKPLIQATEAADEFDVSLFVTGMHTLARYGYTVDEVYKTLQEHRLAQGFRSVYTYMNQVHGEPMDLILANTIQGLSRYVNELKPDLLVVHGDRVEALAGAIVGTLRNHLVAHIEGGELSGAIDEVIRHAVSKLSHIHFVSNDVSAKRLRQLGERPESIFVVGSPDIDIMLKSDLPPIREVLTYYHIDFATYAIILFHPDTTDLAATEHAVSEIVAATLASAHNYVVIYPNNDQGNDLIFRAYEQLQGNPRFQLFPSMRFEYFLSLLKNAQFIIGNSSVGIREAPVYGVYSLNIAGRQRSRFDHASIINLDCNRDVILTTINNLSSRPPQAPCFHFGHGDSASRFLTTLRSPQLWQTPTHKLFMDIPTDCFSAEITSTSLPSGSSLSNTEGSENHTGT